VLTPGAASGLRLTLETRRVPRVPILVFGDAKVRRGPGGGGKKVHDPRSEEFASKNRGLETPGQKKSSLINLGKTQPREC